VFACAATSGPLRNVGSRVITHFSSLSSSEDAEKKTSAVFSSMYNYGRLILGRSDTFARRLTLNAELEGHGEGEVRAESIRLSERA
jgi:hypothetical protein